MFNVRSLDRNDYSAAADELGVGVEVVRAVASVEARGAGFIKGTDLPVILFEGHHFHRLTGGRYARDFPYLSYQKWTSRFYKGGRGEYDRLLEAIRVHSSKPEPALLATSWGMFQIMGFNYARAGYESVIDFVNAMSADEGAQLKAFATFVRSTGLVGALRDLRWAEFARGYNGPGYKANNYDGKLAAAFARERARVQEEGVGGDVDPERANAVELQVALNVALADKLSEKLTTDGWVGEKTRAAIRLFEEQAGMAVSGEDTPGLRAALGLADDGKAEGEAA